MDSSSGTSRPFFNASGVAGVAGCTDSPFRLRSEGSVCALPACSASTAVKPTFLCYCGEPARKLTVGTERNRGHKFLVCRKSEFRKGCRLWIWEDVLMRCVSSMVAYWAPTMSDSVGADLAAARAELADMDTKFSALRQEFEIRETELLTKVQELELELAACRKVADRGWYRGSKIWKTFRFFIYVAMFLCLLFLGFCMGDVMYAEAAGRDVAAVKSAVQEGGVYTFSKFLVANMKSSYRPFRAKYMIKLTPWTRMVPVNTATDSFPRFVFHLSPLADLSSRVGSQMYFTELLDVLAMVVAVSNVTYVRVATNSTDTPRRVIVLKDLSGFEIKLVLWGSRAIEFDADTVYRLGQEHAVVGIFVGTLVKSYKGEETLTGGSACKWYLNEDIAEIDEFFERLSDDFIKIEWISDNDDSNQRFQKVEHLLQKTVSELRSLDPWETEGANFRCTVTVVRLSTAQPWWFLSCSRCHRAATACGSDYKCAGGCINTSAIPKYRVCLVGSDGIAAVEFVLFGRVAQQVIGKPVVALMRSDGIPQEIAAVVSQKFTFAVSISQRSLMQRVVSFQVNSIETFFGRQASIPDIREYDDVDYGSQPSSSGDLVATKEASTSTGLITSPRHVSSRRMPLSAGKDDGERLGLRTCITDSTTCSEKIGGVDIGRATSSAQNDNLATMDSLCREGASSGSTVNTASLIGSKVLEDRKIEKESKEKDGGGDDDEQRTRIASRKN
ncbi:replication protein A 70 kDa DNA-binding subunit B-like [Panicum miliaceum]|uniref:Replication protein A 70 kDa DNA-binding subunit B-like n=1 Tax=Panicum miliaceum TaxID=4540 RepID=A0A3L6R6U6_PANMI|nr:replication protein A 70 kDa DNA-binding subunit B-like [Panicum miliaceum]